MKLLYSTSFFLREIKVILESKVLKVKLESRALQVLRVLLVLQLQLQLVA